MKFSKIISITLNAILLSTLLFFSHRAYSLDFNKSELTKLKNGEIVRKPLSRSRKDGFYGGTGWIIVDAPEDAVWKALTDWKSYPKVFSRTLGCEPISRKGNKTLLKLEMGYKILRVIYHLEVNEKKSKKMLTYNLVSDKPHDINFTRGYWRLFPQKDGRTLLSYGVSLQVPRGIVNFLGPKLEKQMERALLASPAKIKKWIEKKNK